MEEIVFQTFMVWSVRVLTYFGLGKWQKDFDCQNLDPRAKVVIEEGERLGIRFQRLIAFNRETELFLAQKGSKEILFKHLPLGNSYRQTRQIWVDDKWQAKKILAKHKFPVLPGALVSTLNQALSAAKRLGYPIVIKPRHGSLSKGVFVDNLDQEDLADSFKQSSSLTSRLLIEPQAPGHDYRITLINGGVRGVLKREPANVTGDGQQTIAELIREKNQHPLRTETRFATHRKIPLAKLPKDYLQRKKIKLSNIPKKDQKVYLHNKINLANGADLIDATDHLHPENRKLFEKIAKLFDAEVIGIDFKSRDISQSYKKNQGIILELNSLPYLNMHYQPWIGKKIPIAKYLWQRIFD